MDGTSKTYGVIAEFTTAADVLHAAQKVRDAGCTRWDVFTPFPVHGMDKAMGLGKSWLSAPVLIGGTTGLVLSHAAGFATGFLAFGLMLLVCRDVLWVVARGVDYVVSCSRFRRDAVPGSFHAALFAGTAGSFFAFRGLFASLWPIAHFV